jgi:chromosome segregation ATPase
MRTGITQNQVNQAADAILATGENPTVEKVRAELGTGSPNTITRMLDSWRGQLGERLRRLSAIPEVPDAVGQAMLELWRLATEHAERAIDERFTNERAALEAARTQLAGERENWGVRLAEAETSAAQAQTARDLAEHICTTLDGQLQDSHALRADILHQRGRLQDQYDQQAEQCRTLRAQLDQLHAALQTERERQEAHIRAVEDRLHCEVDRARQDAGQWQQRYENAQRTHRDATAATENRRDSLIARVRELEQETARQAGQISGLEKALSEAYTATAKPKRQLSPKTKSSTLARAPNKSAGRQVRK